MYGLYEENEYPKRCRKCGSGASRILQTWTARQDNGAIERRRKRKCKSCGNEFVTLTKVDDKFIVNSRLKEERFV